MVQPISMNPTGTLPELPDELYYKIAHWLKLEVGVDLGDSRKTLMTSRLSKILITSQLHSIQELFDAIQDPNNIKLKQLIIDSLTTHETYFYREAEHLDYIKQLVLPKAQAGFSIWSAACSTGEEAYTLALICATHFKSMENWSILGTDISPVVVDHADRGIYPNARLKLVPPDILKQFFKKGINQQEGFSAVVKRLKQHTCFKVDNLLEPSTKNYFDLIFCRNVLIYFDNPTKEKVIHNLLERLKPGGILISGRCEPIRQFAKNAKIINHSILAKV
jgi:chemotaxis protein methyltransferase CheR